MNITIPPEALRDGADVVKKLRKQFWGTSDEDLAKEVCLAMLQSWPGMERKLTVKGIDTRRHRVMVDPHIILPLTEPSDD